MVDAAEYARTKAIRSVIPRNTSGGNPADFFPEGGATYKPVPQLPENGGPGFPGVRPPPPAPSTRPMAFGGPTPPPVDEGFPSFGQFFGQGRDPMPKGSFNQNMLDATRRSPPLGAPNRGPGGAGVRLPPGMTLESVYDAPDVAGAMGSAGRTPPPVPPSAPPAGGPPPRGPISGVLAPAAALGGMMYGADQRAHDPNSLAYHALTPHGAPKNLEDVKNNAVDMALGGADIAQSNLGLGRTMRVGADLADAYHRGDLLDAGAALIRPMAEKMAAGYTAANHWLHNENDRGFKRMPAGPMMIEAPMPKPRDGDPNSPFPDPLATPINKTPAKFALDMDDATRQAQRPGGRPGMPTMKQSYDDYVRSQPLNKLDADGYARRAQLEIEARKGDLTRNNVLDATRYNLAHPEYVTGRKVGPHGTEITYGDRAQDAANAYNTLARNEDAAREASARSANDRLTAQANLLNAKTAQTTAARAPVDRRDPVKVQDAGTLRALAKRAELLAKDIGFDAAYDWYAEKKQKLGVKESEVHNTDEVMKEALDAATENAGRR